MTFPFPHLCITKASMLNSFAHTFSFFFPGETNFPCLFPKCSSSVYFLDPVFSSFLSFQIFSLHEIILNPLEALSYLPPLKITIIPNQWLLQLLFSSPRDFCMGYFPIVLSLFYTCTTTWTVNQSSLKPFCCCIQSPYFKVNRRGKCGNSDRFIFSSSQINAHGDYNYEMKRCLLLGRKAMTNLKSRGISLLTKVCIAKAMIFLVVT